LGAPDRILGGVLMAFNAIGTSIILFLTIITDTEVISRKLADIPGLNDLMVSLQRLIYGDPAITDKTAFVFGPIEGVFELGELAIVLIVFLQLGYATRSGKMVQSDGLASLLLKKVPAAGHALAAFFNLLGMLFFLGIIFGGFDVFTQHYTEDLWAGTQGLFSVPTWPAKFVVLIGSAGVALQLFFFALQHLKIIRQIQTR
jgi:TRAP-type C4-dicarboxylate transport system permease small subunit